MLLVVLVRPIVAGITELLAYVSGLSPLDPGDVAVSLDAFLDVGHHYPDIIDTVFLLLIRELRITGPDLGVVQISYQFLDLVLDQILAYRFKADSGELIRTPELYSVHSAASVDLAHVQCECLSGDPLEILPDPLEFKC